MEQAVKHPSEVLKKGDVVEAMVLNIDAENQRLSLGLKQLATDIWDDFFSRHHVGDTIEGKVVRMTNFGAFVELRRRHRRTNPRVGVRRLARWPGREERIELKVGEAYPMKIIKLAPAGARSGCRFVRSSPDEFRADWEAYQEGSSDGGATLGDHFRNRQSLGTGGSGARGLSDPSLSSPSFWPLTYEGDAA